MAELSKAVSSVAIRWALGLGMVLPMLLAWYNGSGVREKLAAGRWEYGQDLHQIGSAELLLAAAAAAVLCAVLVGSEYVAMPHELGGGWQATTTALAVSSRGTVLAAKLAVALGLTLLLASGAAFGALFTAQTALGDFAVELDAARWGQGVAGMAYVTLYGLLSFAVVTLVRHPLVPLIYLVANQTVVSVGYLLTQVTHWAWYLPDTSAMALLKDPPDVGQPGVVTSASVAVAWVVGLLGLAVVVERRRQV